MINSTNIDKNSVGKNSIDKHFEKCILYIINQKGQLIFAKMPNIFPTIQFDENTTKNKTFSIFII